MAQAFVRKLKNLNNETASTIKIPKAKSLIDENQIKNLIWNTSDEFLKDVKSSDSSQISRAEELASRLTLLINEKLKEHKIVVHCTIIEQWGQGVKSTAKCLWDVNCDKVISVNFKTEDYIVIVSAFCLRIIEDSSEEEDDLIDE